MEKAAAKPARMTKMQGENGVLERQLGCCIRQFLNRNSIVEQVKGLTCGNEYREKIQNSNRLHFFNTKSCFNAKGLDPGGQVEAIEYLYYIGWVLCP
ncbi:hypothetical protein [Paraflavitalea speifideaquila]|uniref:hypothetical protein n=1 Tax=Paraflavitalea speifideaquila TaxID=3076558 RepID=UPI0028E22CC1|nr:hypothetical protein [Paraflavitalea speifideiaquila]